MSGTLLINGELTDSQIDTLIILERVGGSISLFGVTLIFIFYGLVRASRNVQNTFIVFASVSNVGASIACIIAMDGLAAGKTSALCQAQSFLFEMFMQSDPWWSLAMAVNVFLVFYFRTSPGAFRKWWWVYCVVCYGGPLIIAISLLLVRSHGRPPVYGEATIWCWVDRQWDDIRIYTYYMLIWICIIGSFLCYFLVGYNVFHSRNKLRSFSSLSRNKEVSHLENMNLPDVPQDGFYGTVITEVQVVHSKAAASPTVPISPPRRLSQPRPVHNRDAIHVSFDEPISEHSVAGSGSGSHRGHHYFSSVTSTTSKPLPRRPYAAQPAAVQSVQEWSRSAANKFVIEDPVKRAYLRTSFLFALSVLVTWIPSSMNRIHSWQTGTSPYEYHVATASVLPLQGLWNAVIFFVTSWDAVSRWWREHVVDKWFRTNGVNVATRERPTREERDPWTVRGGRGDGQADSDGEYAESGTMGSDEGLRGFVDSGSKSSERF